MKAQFRHTGKGKKNKKKTKKNSNFIENIYEFTFLIRTTVSLFSKFCNSHQWEQKVLVFCRKALGERKCTVEPEQMYNLRYTKLPILHNN